ncbi:hypothetical protein TNCV_4064081 [Trichonephila clavipes]|nr:hypothetical protein TNCV_4064081 [Trichonephila clavipes]
MSQQSDISELGARRIIGRLESEKTQRIVAAAIGVARIVTTICKKPYSFFFITEPHSEFEIEPDEINNGIEEVVDLFRQDKLDVYSDDVQELLDTYIQELKVDELTELREQEHDIEELDSLDPIQSEDQRMTGNLIENISLIQKG